MATAGCLSDYAENKFIDLVMAETAFSSPAAVYVGLCSAAADTGVTEVAYTDYARQAITFGAVAARAITQSALVTFPQCGATGATADFYGIFDAATAGNLLAWGALGVQKVIVSGNTQTIPSGQVVLTVSAGGMSDYLAGKCLNHIFRATAYTAPTDRYLALTTVDITDSMTGSTITEPSGSGYERKTSGAWTVTGGSAVNAADEDFAAATGSWGEITSAAVLDAATAGNLLFYDAAPTGQGQTPTSGDTVSFPAGDFAVSVA
jgi:hypothetical protein